MGDVTLSVADTLRQALAGLDRQAVRRSYRDQNEFVYLERWLPAGLIDRMLAEVERVRPAIHRNDIPRHKNGGSVSFYTLLEQAHPEAGGMDVVSRGEVEGGLPGHAPSSRTTCGSTSVSARRRSST